ncbi:MAG TPA: ferredoxin [Candidatus Nanopelagicaceae bacterium]|nr:ferredoxin [Candidatus Nanopelagicaceae bacterium]
MKIVVDMSKCQHYGQCCFEAEDVFQLDDDGKLTYADEVDDSRRNDVESAADVCPMQAITIE